MKLIAFCEAPADFRVLSGLADRVLRDHVAEHGPAWVLDQLDTPEAADMASRRCGRRIFDLHQLNDYADRLRARGVRVRQARGHFDGRPGGSGGAMARKAFLIAEALHRRARDEPIDAVVLVADVDQEPELPGGVRAARDEARRWASFHVACGFPDPEREAWLLTGFDPCAAEERQVLDDVHRELTFSPVLAAHRLRDKNRGAPRNIKRVLGLLSATISPAKPGAGWICRWRPCANADSTPA